MKNFFTICILIFFYATAEGQITSAASGNWNNPATWVGGIVPTQADVVNIASTHTVTMNVNGAARTLTISSGAVLTINTSGATLTVGDYNTGGGKDSVVVYGTINISNGALNIGGRFRLYASPATYNQTGGIIRIDGNTGIAGTSVADADYLFRSDRDRFSGYTFNGGSLIFIDPPSGVTGNCMLWAGTMYLNSGSTIQLGDGISTTAGGNAQGFIYNTYVGSNLIVNNPSGTNRGVYCPAIQLNALTVTAGTVTSNGLDVIGATVNNGSITTTGNIDYELGLTNNGIISATGQLRVFNNNFTNNTGATVTAPTMFLPVNITNNGTINASTTFALSVGTNTNNTQAQIIDGTGNFNISTAILRVGNTNASGITLNRSLTVNTLTLLTGKIFLGSSDITYSNPSVTSGATAYIVTNGTGRLRFNNLTTSEVLYPIGTSTTYNPVRINNGSGHTFTVGVKSGFTVPPPGTQHVNREWDIDDETGGAVSATVTLQWNAADEDPTFNRSSCTIMHYGAAWSLVGTTGAATGANPYTKTATGISSFSPFGVTSNSLVLPLTLKHFRALKEGNGIKLLWKTTDEINTSHFDIERSSNGTAFSNIIRVNSFNSTGDHNYASLDVAPLMGVNYYRLKMTDKDGHFKYSAIVKVDLTKSIQVVVSPNPAQDHVNIYGLNGSGLIIISDIGGKIILRQKITQSTENINISKFASGLYLVRIDNQDKAVTLKLQKQ